MSTLGNVPSDTESVDDVTIETNFYSIIKKLICHASLTALLGTDSTIAYPGIAEDLEDLDHGMRYLLLDVPR